MEYLKPIPDLLSTKTMVDCEDLAVALGHENEDAVTELLELRDRRNSETYVLRLCGTVKIKDSQGMIHYATGLDVGSFRQLRDAGCEFIWNPWFEWIRGDGDTLLEPEESIYTDPAEEISCFAESIGAVFADMEATVAA